MKICFSDKCKGNDTPPTFYYISGHDVTTVCINLIIIIVKSSKFWSKNIFHLQRKKEKKNFQMDEIAFGQSERPGVEERMIAH